MFRMTETNLRDLKWRRADFGVTRFVALDRATQKEDMGEFTQSLCVAPMIRYIAKLAASMLPQTFTGPGTLS